MLVFAVSCSKKDDETNKFLNVYKEIMIVREQTADSEKASIKINNVLKKNGYTEPEFRAKFMELSKDRVKFLRLLDSVRNKAGEEAQTRKLPTKQQKAKTPSKQ